MTLLRRVVTRAWRLLLRRPAAAPALAPSPRIHFHLVRFGDYHDRVGARSIGQTRVIDRAQSAGDVIEALCPEDTMNVTDTAGNRYQRTGSTWAAFNVRASPAATNRVTITRAASWGRLLTERDEADENLLEHTRRERMKKTHGGILDRVTRAKLGR